MTEHCEQSLEAARRTDLRNVTIRLVDGTRENQLQRTIENRAERYRELKQLSYGCFADRIQGLDVGDSLVVDKIVVFLCLGQISLSFICVVLEKVWLVRSLLSRLEQLNRVLRWRKIKNIVNHSGLMINR